MSAVLYQYLCMIRRRPLAFWGSMILTILFAAVLGGGGGQLTVPAASDTLADEDLAETAERLSDQAGNRLSVDPSSVNEMEEKIRRSSPPYGVMLEETEGSVIQVYEAPETALLLSDVQSFYREQNMEAAVAESLDLSLWQERVADYGFQYELEQAEGAFPYDQSLHPLFGFMLFFVIYAVAFSLSTIVAQRNDGTWDRLILSPVTKLQLYLGHVTFAFVFGLVQMYMILFLFRFVFQVDFHGGFWFTLAAVIPYVLAVVCLGILLSGLVRSYKMLDAIIPLTAVSMAMLGGAFWPIELVPSGLLQQIGELIPLKHGMDLLIGTTYGGASLESLMLSASILLLMSVLFAGVGFNLIERR
ncbi:ABC transporter permease [Salisediminibacterium halotolerans]|uniref:ABC-2 type transport system permease protein n=1 Tax=Salisediminibacterium halotolerans TaxID=517425 RepID=A0A1H9SYV5_9BACI|nr:ABC transporter permease [Salisediminibacterium haloalkalitolerans]SER90017.1 ABC-2 type transport system permease protein [Salisediminibacterium haloalkalitolerans]